MKKTASARPVKGKKSLSYRGIEATPNRRTPQTKTSHEVAMLSGAKRQAQSGTVRDDRRSFTVLAWMIRRHLDNVSRFTPHIRTGDDKLNLVESLLAKTEFGVPRFVARVNHPKNELMFDSTWGVDVAVSTPRMLSALVEEAVSVGDLVRLFSFRQGEADLLEITLASDSPVAGQRVGAQTWPEDTALVAIVRGDRVIAPTADDPLEIGDELIFVASPRQESALQQMLGHS
jgi:hypothetical protein